MPRKKTDAPPPEMPPVETPADDLDLPPEDEAPAEPKPAQQLPYVCEPGDRASEGQKRFKFRLDGHPTGARSQRYVLAQDRASAESCYLAFEKIGPKEVDDRAVQLVVTELAD
jgi:hypothetical protein